MEEELAMKPEATAPSPTLDLSSAAAVLSELAILSVQIEDWAVLQRSRFDVCVEDDPFSAAQVYVNLTTHEYSLRVWGRVLHKGRIGDDDATSLGDLCQSTFGHNVAFCPGLPADQPGKMPPPAAGGEQLVTLDYPFERTVSAGCQIMFNSGGGGSLDGSCRLCPTCEAATNLTQEEAEKETILDDSAIVPAVKMEEEDEEEESMAVEDFEVDFEHETASSSEDESNAPEDEEDEDYVPPPSSSLRETRSNKRKSPIKPNIDEFAEEDTDTGVKEEKKARKKSALKPKKKEKESAPNPKPKKIRRKKAPPGFPWWAEHNPEDDLKCKFCNKLLTLLAVRKHCIRNHLYKLYPCPAAGLDCRFVGTLPREVAAHLLERHPGEDSMKCPVCLNSLSIADDAGSSLEAHMMACYKKKYSVDRAAATALPVPHVCDLCGKKLCTKSALTNHKRLHTEDHFNRRFKCEEPGCNEAFAYKATLLKHSYTHLRRKGIRTPDDAQCELCGHYLSSKNALMKHIRKVHEKRSDNIKCDLCDEIFDNPCAQRRHKNLVHFPEKFACKICHQPNGSKEQLKRHMVQHEEPKFECQHCGKMLKRKITLIEHVRLHTGEKPFACEHCDYRCQSFTVLNNHIKFSHKAEFAAAKIKKLREKVKRTAD